MDDYLSEREQWERSSAGCGRTPLGPGRRCRRRPGAWRLSLVAGTRDTHGARGRRAKYMQMENAFAQGNRTEALCILLGELERQYPLSPYADQAKLASARAFVEDGQLEQAADELAAVMQHSQDHELAHRATEAGTRADRAEQARLALATLNGAEPGALAPQYARGARRRLLRQGRQGRGARAVSCRRGQALLRRRPPTRCSTSRSPTSRPMRPPARRPHPAGRERHARRRAERTLANRTCEMTATLLRDAASRRCCWPPAPRTRTRDSRRSWHRSRRPCASAHLGRHGR